MDVPTSVYLALLSFTVLINVFIVINVHNSLDLSSYQRTFDITPISRSLKNDGNNMKNELNGTILNPILPKHTILVTGLESSGTKYITSALALATEVVKPKRMRRSNNLNRFHGRVGGVKSRNQVEILHHSLPHGAWCTIYGKQLQYGTSSYLAKVFETWTVPFIPPTQCSCAKGILGRTLRHFMHGQRRRDMIMHKREMKERTMERLQEKYDERHLEGKRGGQSGDDLKRDFLERERHLHFLDEEEFDDDRLKRENAIFTPSDECETWEDSGHEETINGYCVDLGINKPIESPMRHFVNITTHIKWYQERGVRATAVIVVRDQTIESISKYNEHCKDKNLVQAENEYGKLFIEDAFRNLSQDGPTPTLVLVSFEALMNLGETYLRTQIYPKLGIDGKNMSIPVPEIFDSNGPYIIKD